MQLSIFIAQAVALVYLTLGIGLLVNKDYYKRFFHDYYTETSAMYIGALMALILGLYLVQYHNLWVADWRVLITLIGWLSLAKGLLIIIFPQKMAEMTKMIRNPETLTPLLFLLGGIFAYFGFIAY